MSKNNERLIQEQLPFAKSIYQDVLDVWLLETINVKKVKEALTNFDSGKKDIQAYSISPAEMMKITHETFNTHKIGFSSIGLYLFPQQNKPFHSLFKSTKQLFQEEKLMNTLKENSETLRRLTYVFAENGLNLTTLIGGRGELVVEVKQR